MSIASRGLAVVLAAGLLFILSCGDDDGSRPSGWQEFAAGPYSGAVDADWLYTYLTLDGGAEGNLPEQTPESVSAITERFFGQDGAQSVLFVFLDQDAEYGTNLNIVPCEPPQRERVVSTTQEVIAYYEAFGYEAEAVDEVTFNGETRDLLSVKLGDQVDTYQTYIRTADCYQAVTLTTRPGDEAPIEALKSFLSHLEVEVEGLPAPLFTPQLPPTATPQVF